MTEREVPRWPAITSRTRGQVGRERGGHLVEEQGVRLDRQRPRKIDDSQRRQRQVAHACARRGSDPEVGDPRAKRVRGVSVRMRFSPTVRSRMIAGS